MIVCLEGPSAVGKTTRCRALQENLNAVVVPEVNALFARPRPEPEDWYLERQAARYGLAAEASRAGGLAVLDGDPFQPLWYNWSFGFRDCLSLDSLRRFYRPLAADGALGFPDRYFLLMADEGELRRRRDGDAARTRRNFERHLVLISTLPRYFGAMAPLAPDLVDVAQADGGADHLGHIKGRLTPRPPMTASDALGLFDALTDWLGGSAGGG